MSDNASQIELAQSLETIAIDIARAAGARIVELRNAGVSVAGAKSSAVDVVTEADREAERLITAAILEARPDDGVFGEEGTGVEGTSGITWVIDPIDGTVNYLYGIPFYTVSVAATMPSDAFHDGRQALAGAVYNPNLNEMFHAHAGGGSRLNGAPISPSGHTELSTALIATGFGYLEERRAYQATIAQQLIPRVRDIRRFGSAASDLCWVAAGRVDAFYENGLQPWDYAAGALIAAEAGLSVIGLADGTAPGEPFIFVAAPGFVEELRDAVFA